MKIIRFTFNPFGVNTYLVYDETSKECAIIDPGMVSVEEFQRLLNVVEQYELKPVHLINTHMHVDHVFGNNFVRKQFGLKMSANEKDAFLGARLADQKRMFGIADNGTNEIIEQFLTDGDEIKLGTSVLKILEVPGHSPGGISLYSKEDKFVITGDSLFQMSIGRTDLPGGDMPTLLKSINDKLMSLPDDTKVYPGHGEASSIGFERTHNPFL